MIPGPPTVYQSLLAHPRRGDYDLSSLRLGVTGAAAVPVQLVHDMKNILGFETVVTAYGLTELCRDDVANARLVANPGCYPTASLLALAPIADLAKGPVVIDAKSGATLAAIAYPA